MWLTFSFSTWAFKKIRGVQFPGFKGWERHSVLFHFWPLEDRIWGENYFEETSIINPVCLPGKDKSLAEILLKREPGHGIVEP